MIVKQLTVFLQNEPGRLEELTSVLQQEKINISALSIAETEEYGIVRMIVSNPEKAEEKLKKKGFSVKTTQVIGVEVPDEPGTLHHILKRWADGGINVRYMYGYSNCGAARLIMKVSDPEKATKILEEENLWSTVGWNAKDCIM